MSMLWELVIDRASTTTKTTLKSKTMNKALKARKAKAGLLLIASPRFKNLSGPKRGTYGERKEKVVKEIKATMVQCDWSSNFEKNGLDDLTWTMNFGTGANIDAELKELLTSSYSGLYQL